MFQRMGPGGLGALGGQSSESRWRGLVRAGVWGKWALLKGKQVCFTSDSLDLSCSNSSLSSPPKLQRSEMAS